MIDVALYRFRIGVFSHSPKSKSKPKRSLNTPQVMFECDDFNNNILSDLLLYFILYVYIVFIGFTLAALERSYPWMFPVLS